MCSGGTRTSCALALKSYFRRSIIERDRLSLCPAVDQISQPQLLGGPSLVHSVDCDRYTSTAIYGAFSTPFLGRCTTSCRGCAADRWRAWGKSRNAQNSKTQTQQRRLAF